MATQLGYGLESVRSWATQADIDEGVKTGVASDGLAEILKLEQENRELTRANEFLRRAASFFQAEPDRHHKWWSFLGTRIRTTLCKSENSAPG
jgi:transposase